MGVYCRPVGVAPHTGAVTSHDEQLPDDGPGGRLHVDPADPTTLVAVGEIDVFVVEELAEGLGVGRSEAGRALATTGVRTVDVTQVVYIDSGFIGLIGSLAASSAPERVAVRGAAGQAKDVLTLTGVDALVDLT